MLGDDVFVNLARLYYFLALHPADDHPIIFSHVLSDTEVYDFDMPCSSSGIVLSRPALDLLAERASCKECPYVGSDAISLAYCAFYTAIPLVHVPGLHCHPPPIGTADQILTSDLLAHDWIAAGGLSASDLGKRADEIHDDGQLMIHPFEEDFPSSDCKLPSESLWWTAQQLLERMAYCQAASGRQPSSHAQSPPPELVDGSELLPDSIDDYFEARWPGSLAPGLLEEVVLEGEIASDWPNARRALFRHLHREDELDEEVASEGAAQWEESDSQWYFLRSVDTWLHHAEVGRFLKDLEASVLLPQIGSLASPAGSGPALVFAFVQSSLAAPPRAAAGSGDVLDLRGGLLLSRSAAWALVGREGRAATSRAAASAVAPRQLVAAALAALGISLVHTPWLVPDSAALPQTLSGLISEAAVSGSWSIGQVPHQTMLDDLDGKADDRRFFAGLLVENFEDLAKANGGAPCGDVRTGAAASTLASARDWMRFLHDDDEHIKVVRGFQSGRREFRTLHAMYRSEASGELPLHGVNPDTVLVARNCPKEP
ncbi:unnamed protein product [Polarella glacialis]|nr:unnamed protein product [Polarella glacialis]